MRAATQAGSGSVARAWLHALACTGVVTGLEASSSGIPMLGVSWNGGTAACRTGAIMWAMSIDVDTSISSPTVPAGMGRSDLPYAHPARGAMSTNMTD